MGGKIPGAESRVESPAPLFVLVPVECEKVSRARHGPCEVFSLFVADGESVCSNCLAHCRVINDGDRLAAERPEIQIDDGRASGCLGEVVTPVHDNVSSRICARGILGIEVADAFEKHEVAEDERVLGSDHLPQVSPIIR